MQRAGATQRCLRVHSRFLAPSPYLYSNSASEPSKRSEDFSMNKQKAVRQKIKIKKSPKVSPAALGFGRTREGGLVQALCVSVC